MDGRNDECDFCDLNTGTCTLLKHKTSMNEGYTIKFKATSKVCEYPLPPTIQNCISRCKTKLNTKVLMDQREESIHYYCQNQYVVQRANETWNQDGVPKININSLQQFSDIFELFDVEESNPVKKMKRATPINRQPNAYDWFVNLHPAAVAPSAHFGPAFLGFHRTYLFLFERQLQKYEPEVFIPFWDSSFDNLLEDPTSSAIFTSSGVGPGTGIIREGPFSDWKHEHAGVLIRNIGSSGSLFSREFIELFLSQNRIEDIAIDRTKIDTSLEFHHGSVHNWVSGTLSDINYSPADPLFFMHHCFVDALWERFRENQIQRGFDPEWYPLVDGGHAPDAPMRPLLIGKEANGEDKYLKNKIGYSKSWSLFVKYDDPPYNCDVDSDCRSVLMRCERKLCQPLTIEEHERMHFQHRAKRELLANLSTPYPAMKRNYEHTHLGRNIDATHQFNLKTSPFYHSFQNSFVLNGKEDISNWVFIPVMIYKKRSNGQNYDAFPIRNGVPDFSSGDVFQQDFNIKSKPSSEQMGSSKTERCSHIGSGISKVYVKTFGLDYRGFYTDHALLDERFPLSSALSAVGVKKPDNNRSSHVLITAHDSCGKMCTAYCLNSSTRSIPTEYKKCSGSSRISTTKPSMYRSTVGEALLSAYNISSINPSISKENIAIIFHCG
ncbi:uncharacterized protein LOC125669076 [Ostrea edulis]|uniref:uncharacterized protein LOC125669076 n=1 Tax=Ostrea edulis TaxID=37623 RepID=UPI0024AF7D87|nr:uncharacterized protein LOC125669076 [Ostrea edulis]